MDLNYTGNSNQLEIPGLNNFRSPFQMDLKPQMAIVTPSPTTLNHGASPPVSSPPTAEHLAQERSTDNAFLIGMYSQTFKPVLLHNASCFSYLLRG